MILTAGERTDIVQYYFPWFLNRIHEGYVDVRNPFYPSVINRYPINHESVDVIVLCSKNYQPALSSLDQIMDYPLYCFYTITAYGKDIEPNVPSVEDSINTFISLSKLVGKERCAWRYDPILIYGPYTVETHLKTFAYMAEKLSPYADRCIFSFVYMYRKLSFTFPDLKPVSISDQRIILQGMHRIAEKNHLILQTCGDSRDLSEYGVHKSGCLTKEILEQSNHIALDHIPLHNQRPGTGCMCIDQRAVGAYNTCMNGCRYCYANNSKKIILDNYKNHDPSSSILIGHISSNDKILESKPKSYRRKIIQESLF